MRKKDLYRIINEEVGEFDFLGIDDSNIDLQNHNLVHSREFQIQFVSDVINEFNNKDLFTYNFVFDSKKTDNILNSFNAEGTNVSFDIDVEYKYQGESIGMYIILEGENIDSEDKEHSDNWVGNFNVKFFDEKGSIIKFDWLIEKDDIFKQFVETLVAEHLTEE